MMSETAAAETVSLSREEYEALLKGAPKQTVTVDAAEYAELVGVKAELVKVAGERDRYCTRCRELETCLGREQREHREEIEAAQKHIRKLTGQPG
jgi:hypothetical protein